MLTSITLKSKRFSDVFKWYRNETLGWSLCFLFLYTVVLCAIDYHLHNLKNAKDTHGRKLLSVKTQDKTCNVTKSNTLSWVFSTFLNCTNGTNLRKASHIFSKRKHLKDCEECFLFYQKSYFFLEIFKFCTFLFPSLWTKLKTNHKVYDASLCLNRNFKKTNWLVSQKVNKVWQSPTLWPNSTKCYFSCVYNQNLTWNIQGVCMSRYD